MAQVIGWLKDVKRSVFGYEYAPDFVRQQAEEGWETEAEGYHEKLVEKALRDHFSDKSPEEVEQHLSLLERHVEDVEQHEEDLLQQAKKDATRGSWPYY